LRRWKRRRCSMVGVVTRLDRVTQYSAAIHD
jgi:hypothetical protein